MQSVILVAFTAFTAPDPASSGRYVKPLRFEGQLEDILLEASLRHVDHRYGRTSGSIIVYFKIYLGNFHE